jgi:hypothetical protein
VRELFDDFLLAGLIFNPRDAASRCFFNSSRLARAAEANDADTRAKASSKISALRSVRTLDDEAAERIFVAVILDDDCRRWSVEYLSRERRTKVKSSEISSSDIFDILGRSVANKITCSLSLKSDNSDGLTFLPLTIL